MELTLRLLGIEELWIEKKIHSSKIIIAYDELSDEGLILLKNMLLSIGIFMDKDQIRIIENFSKENFFNCSNSKIFLLTNKSFDSEDGMTVFICPHPNQILADASLKPKAWAILIDMKMVFREFF